MIKPGKCYTLLSLLILFSLSASMSMKAQTTSSIVLMDFVKIKEGKKAEAMYFYENNWKLYRDAALKNKIIESYQLVEVAPDSLSNFDLILITVYSDSAQHAKSEANFAPILKEIRPNGPTLLNELKPAEFRQNVFVKITRPVFLSDRRKGNK